MTPLSIGGGLYPSSTETYSSSSATTKGSRGNVSVGSCTVRRLWGVPVCFEFESDDDCSWFTVNVRSFSFFVPDLFAGVGVWAPLECAFSVFAFVEDRRELPVGEGLIEFFECIRNFTYVAPFQWHDHFVRIV